MYETLLSSIYMIQIVQYYRWHYRLTFALIVFFVLRSGKQQLMFACLSK